MTQDALSHWPAIAASVASEALLAEDSAGVIRRLLRGLMALHGLHGALLARRTSPGAALVPFGVIGYPDAPTPHTETVAAWARASAEWSTGESARQATLMGLSEPLAKGGEAVVLLAGVAASARTRVADDGRAALQLALRIDEAHRLRSTDREERDRLKSIIEATEAGTWEWHVPSGTARMNARWAAIAGRDLTELEPLSVDTWASLVHPDDLSETVERLEAHLAGRAPRFEAIYRVRHKDGSWVWVQDRGRIVRLTSDGRPEWLVGSHVDISALKRFESQLQAANANLESRVQQRTQELELARHVAEEASRAKDEFLTNISHELRSPLHSILGFTGLVLDDLPNMEAATIRRFVEKSRASASDLLKLVNDLLDAAKIESGRLVIQPEACRLGLLMDEVAGEFEVAVRNKGLSLELSRPDELALDADPGRLGQAVRNVLANAIRFSPTGGRIRIAASRPATNLVRLQIEDQGPGIPEEELEAVFDRFTQSSRTKTGAGGTGLGLPIARGIIELHGGRLWAERPSGGGTTFCFELPAA